MKKAVLFLILAAISSGNALAYDDITFFEERLVIENELKSYLSSNTFAKVMKEAKVYARDWLSKQDSGMYHQKITEYLTEYDRTNAVPRVTIGGRTYVGADFSQGALETPKVKKLETEKVAATTTSGKAGSKQVPAEFKLTDKLRGELEDLQRQYCCGICRWHGHHIYHARKSGTRGWSALTYRIMSDLNADNIMASGSGHKDIAAKAAELRILVTKVRGGHPEQCDSEVYYFFQSIL